MEWNYLYRKEKTPSMEAVNDFIGCRFWLEFETFMAENCPAAPKMEYSACTMQPGWNLKYKKNGKNVCTIYPMEGYFICMILIGDSGSMETEARLPEFTPYVRELYHKTRIHNGSRWLYMEVRGQAVERDLQELVLIKLKTMGIRPGPRPAAKRTGTGGTAHED